MAPESTMVSSNIEEMSRSLAKTKDPELIGEFLRSLLTTSEVDEIAKRWALVKDLAKGMPQREISANLGLSLCKITRGSRELKKDDSAFRRMLVTAGYDIPDKIVMKRGPRAKKTPGA